MRSYDDPLSATETVALSFKQFAAQVIVDEMPFLADAELQVQRAAFGQLAYQLRAKVLTDDLPPEQFTASTPVAFEVPASTWQMWKKRHAHRWYARRLVARWAVRYEPDPDGRGATATCAASLERWRAYPQATVQLPPERFGDPVLFHVVRDVQWNRTASQNGM